MPYNRLSTAKIAREVGCHPNTVRIYEAWGFLPPVPRNSKGYRLYTRTHLNQMRLARLALNTTYPGKKIRHSVVQLVKYAATGDLGGALELAYQHQAIVASEQAQAEAAVSMLERWAQGMPTDSTSCLMRIGDTAHLLNISVDMLRNWERNGLVEVPRDEESGYRQYSQVEIARLRVIRMLRSAGYGFMAILRMMNRLDRGEINGLRQALDTPGPDEDVYSAADRWLSTLVEQMELAERLIRLLEERIQTGE
ncbi:MAG TPA: MerR family transcriptional regulator [Anaerolineaceae bacterium]|nr:MerR family transcriptional regulator [Anaerolineaceae bacterium]HPN52887.1 MerR family transcriptional regulator [Anaerolineaceae bacterium]